MLKDRLVAPVAKALLPMPVQRTLSLILPGRTVVTTDPDPLQRLRQSDMREWFRRHGTEAWTVVYRSWRDEDANGALFAAFAGRQAPQGRRRGEVISAVPHLH